MTDTTVQRPQPSLVWLVILCRTAMRTVCETQDESVPQRRGNHNNKCMSAWYHPAARHLGKYHVNSCLEHIYSWNKQRTVWMKTLCTETEEKWQHRWRKACGIVKRTKSMEKTVPSCVEPLSHIHTLVGLQHLCFNNDFLPVLTLTNRHDFLKLKTPSAKGKASNTCESKDRARTRVKHQAIRPRHHPITCRGWSFSISMSGIHSSGWQTRTLVLHVQLGGTLGWRESLYRHKNNVSCCYFTICLQPPSTAVTRAHILRCGATHICPCSP